MERCLRVVDDEQGLAAHDAGHRTHAAVGPLGELQRVARVGGRLMASPARSSNRLLGWFQEMDQLWQAIGQFCDFTIVR